MEGAEKAVGAERSKKILSANPSQIGVHVEDMQDTERVLHKDAVNAIKNNAVRNEQRITKALIADPALNPQLDLHLPKESSELEVAEYPKKTVPRFIFEGDDGRISLVPAADLDRLMREKSEREKERAAQAALEPPPPPPPPLPSPSAVFNPQLHKKLERMTEQHIPMKDPYANDDIVQVGDQPEQRTPWKPMKIHFDSNYCLCKHYHFPTRFPFRSFIFFFLSPLVSAWRNRHQRCQGERPELLRCHFLLWLEYR